MAKQKYLKDAKIITAPKLDASKITAEPEYPCRKLPKNQWCDWNGKKVSLGGFMGHTCIKQKINIKIQSGIAAAEAQAELLKHQLKQKVAKMTVKTEFFPDKTPSRRIVLDSDKFDIFLDELLLDKLK